MGSAAIEAYRGAWTPPDKRTRIEWAREHVWTPNMARASRFDPETAPWQQEPINLSASPRTKKMVILWPTGAGKTNVLDCLASYGAAEEDGNMLLAVQGNAESAKYIHGRFLPCLRQIQKTAEALESMGRFAAKKGSIELPGKFIYWGGANETNAQATTARTVIIDEAWMAAHGLLLQFFARLHNRWNGRFVAMGQGGEEMAYIERKGPGGKEKEWVTTEWHELWESSDQREWSFQCPQCGEVQRYRLRGLLYDRGDPKGKIDAAAIIQSARYQCINAAGDEATCDAVFPDRVDIRRSLAKAAFYAPQSANADPGCFGWHINALGIWYEAWGDIALMHARAHRSRKRGDIEPLKIFRQKRMAENHRQQETVPQTALTVGKIAGEDGERDYLFSDYSEGQLWPGEAVRIMGVDVQLDHFWVVVIAWKADGSARMLYADKVATEQGVREIQTRFKVQPIDRTRKPSHVYIDCGFDRELAFTMAGKYGWWAVRGDGTPKKLAYPHIKIIGGKPVPVLKYYSSIRRITSASGFTCEQFDWLNLPIKRILQAMRGGHREPWEVPADLGQDRIDQLFSEIERDGIFTPIKSGEANHIWDCCCMITVGALIANLLRDQPAAAEDSTPSPAPVSIDTPEAGNGRA